MEDNTAAKLAGEVKLSSFGLFLGQVYGWMTLGLLISASVAYSFAFIPSLRIWLYSNAELITVSFLLQLVLVVAISAGITRFNPVVNALLFLIYSALTGFTFTGILWAYEIGSVLGAFVATAGTFMAMSIVGVVTKSDLTKWGNLAIVGLIGVIIATVVNIFLKSSGLDLFLTYAGILIFLVLIAYDTQKLKAYAALADQSGESLRYSVAAALSLYLDFINLFIRLLSLFGKRK